jgi:hypothetical protein
MTNRRRVRRTAGGEGVKSTSNRGFVESARLCSLDGGVVSAWYWNEHSCRVDDLIGRAGRLARSAGGAVLGSEASRGPDGDQTEM